MNGPAPLTDTWLPDGHSTELTAAGVHGWDAVRIPGTPGRWVLAALGDLGGAAIDDAVNVYVLVAAGAADALRYPAAHGIVIVGETGWVVIPGADRTLESVGPHALHWCPPPTDDGEYLTDIRVLQAAIDSALGSRPAMSARCLAACVARPDPDLGVDGQLLHDRCTLPACACPRHLEAS